MTDASSFAKLVPGFDFLQDLVKNAGAALPGIGQWVAPTLDPAELEKRIEELRTVQFWLEQNARMLGATIQALEVQRMTLSTLKTMNVQMEDLRDSLQARPPQEPAVVAQAGAPARPPASVLRQPWATPEAPLSPATSASEAAPPPQPAPAPASGPGAVDPLQWWGALTKQFTELATTAMKDTAAEAARSLGTAAARREALAPASAKAAHGAGRTPHKAAAKSGRRAAKTPAAKAAAPARKKTGTPR